MKKIIIFLLLFVLSIHTTSCYEKPCNDTIFNCYIMSWETDKPLQEDNVYFEITKEELYEKINSKESFILYYGQPECSVCLNNVGYFDENAKKLEIEKIYYLKSTVLSRKTDTDFIDTFVALTGVSSESSPDKLPQLWGFINGNYRLSMRNYLNKDDINLGSASKNFMEEFLLETSE